MQRVLVTGAAGFIGGAMARFCVEQGCSVTGLGHGKPDPFAGLDHWVSGTVSEPVLDRVEERPDIIFHCAGGASVQASVADPEADRARSVTATAALMRWMARAAPEARLVYTSSGAVYGDAAQGDEETRHGLVDAHALVAAELVTIVIAVVQILNQIGATVFKNARAVWEGKYRGCCGG